jgi:hypothetical protein
MLNSDGCVLWKPQNCSQTPLRQEPLGGRFHAQGLTEFCPNAFSITVLRSWPILNPPSICSVVRQVSQMKDGPKSTFPVYSARLSLGVSVIKARPRF